MAACNPNITLHVYFWRLDESISLPPILLDVVDFTLKVAGNGNITGDAFIGATRLSPVTGTCRPITRPNGNVLTLEFNWRLVDIFLLVFTYPVGAATLLRGRFIAQDAVAIPVDFDKGLAVVLTPPDPGETGTATGSQT